MDDNAETIAYFKRKIYVTFKETELQLEKIPKLNKNLTKLKLISFGLTSLSVTSFIFEQYLVGAYISTFLVGNELEKRKAEKEELSLLKNILELQLFVSKNITYFNVYKESIDKEDLAIGIYELNKIYNNNNDVKDAMGEIKIYDLNFFKSFILEFQSLIKNYLFSNYNEIGNDQEDSLNKRLIK